MQGEHSLELGKHIGGFEVIKHIRSGGMAALYLARKQGPGGFERYVAIKVVHPHLAIDQSFVEMFWDEARLSARIQHPNVVHIEAVGLENGLPYIVMEYIHGCPLSSFWKRIREEGKCMSPELAVHIAMRVAEGLHAAHELRGDDGTPLGLVHRDVTPQNILLSYSGHVKLIDFGVAKARGRLHETTAFAIKGKLRYMAPEQAWGLEVDRRTDIYALGIVLWECLTGQRLFKGRNEEELLERVRHPQIPPPSHYAPWVHRELDEAVLRALAVRPEERYATALEMRRTLAQATKSLESVEAEDIAGVLADLMADEIVKAKTELPFEISGVQPIQRSGIHLLLEKPCSQEISSPSTSLHTASQPIPQSIHSKVRKPISMGQVLTVAFILSVFTLGAVGLVVWLSKRAQPLPMPSTQPLAPNLSSSAPSPPLLAPESEAPPQPKASVESAPPLPSVPPTPSSLTESSMKAPAKQRTPKAKKLLIEHVDF
ncbi:MAG: serine/threonine protein kinase [Deltaproteobacteria bacterium]|nr:serine/threonine protein kinase [Deltaproteobacteria bacterium]